MSAEQFDHARNQPSGNGTPHETAASDDPLLDHCYDGIREYDNPLPGWWTWLFLATIAFCPFYWVYYHSGLETRTLAAGYSRAIADNLRLQFAELGELTPARDVILKYADDPKWRTVGKITFDANCVSCHGPKGEGLVGPNLADDFWKHVKQPEDIATVIGDGAASGAMPAWKNRLHPNEVVLLASYLVSIRGSVPEGSGKAPEGPLVPTWDAEAAGDEQPDDEQAAGKQAAGEVPGAVGATSG